VDKAETAARKAFGLLGDDGGSSEAEAAVLEVLCHVMIADVFQGSDMAARQAGLDRAEPYIRRLSVLEPDSPTAIKYLGYIAQTWRRWDEAVERLSAYQQRFPDDPDACRRLAAIHIQEGREDDVMQQLVKLADLLPDDVHVVRRIAALYRTRSDFAQVRAWLRRAIEIDPYDPETHEILGEAALALGRHTEAEHEYSIVVKALPDDAIGYQGLSRVFEAVGRSEAAATRAREAEARRGGFQRVWP
jgi:protein O-GlcNAc transferase